MISLLDLFFNNRGITGKLINPEPFWTEVQKGQFLLVNLKEPELNWSMISFYLNWSSRIIRERKSELEAFQSLYCVWLSIDQQLSLFRDYEIDEWWMYRFTAAEEHLFARIFPILSFADQAKFYANVYLLHKSINNKILMEDLS